jgi:hypothetical protein
MAEDLVMALGAALVRKGVLDADDIIEAAERAAKAGGENADAVAHALNCMVIEAEAPDPSDWQAEQRRKQIRLVTE